MAIFWDLETGSLNLKRSSILSATLGRDQEHPKSFFAHPEKGQWLSTWSENVVANEIKRSVPSHEITSERTLLKRILRVLESGAPGEELIGWNTGYRIAAQSDSKGGGFDIGALLERARAVGMEEEFTKALKRLKIRDVGAEWALHAARQVASRRGQRLVEQGKLDKDLWMSARGYVKEANRLQSQLGLKNEAEVAEWLSRSNIRFVGWKQELINLVETGKRPDAVHKSFEDVITMRGLSGRAKQDWTDEQITTWGKETLINKHVSSLKSGSRNVPTNYAEILAKAEQQGIRSEVVAKVGQLARESGVDINDVRKGFGIAQRGRVVHEGVADVLGKTGAAKLAEAARLTGEFGKRHWGKLAIGAGALALLTTRPGTLFNDERNNAKDLFIPKSNTPFQIGGVTSAKQLGKQSAEKRFSFFKKALEEYGQYTGTGHKRITIPKKYLTEKELSEKLGFQSVLVAIPEAGQDTFSSWRSPENEYHIHSHQEDWTIHEDEHASSTMLLEKLKIERQKRTEVNTQLFADTKETVFTFMAGTPHIVTEGLPGLGYYAVGKLTDAEDMAERLKAEMPTQYTGFMYGGQKFSGKDDKYNTIEGLHHGGQAERMRRVFTQFGSGWRGIWDVIGSRGALGATGFLATGVGFNRGYRQGEEEGGKFDWAKTARLVAMDLADDVILIGGGLVTKALAKRGLNVPGFGIVRTIFEHSLMKQATSALTGYTVGFVGGQITSKFSGKDDAYNTIEGLSHKGIAQNKRHELTDFGSGSIFGMGAWARRQVFTVGMAVSALTPTINNVGKSYGATSNTLTGTTTTTTTIRVGSSWSVNEGAWDTVDDIKASAYSDLGIKTNSSARTWPEVISNIKSSGKKKVLIETHGIGGTGFGVLNRIEGTKEFVDIASASWISSQLPKEEGYQVILDACNAKSALRTNRGLKVNEVRKSARQIGYHINNLYDKIGYTSNNISVFNQLGLSGYVSLEDWKGTTGEKVLSTFRNGGELSPVLLEAVAGNTHLFTDIPTKTWQQSGRNLWGTSSTGIPETAGLIPSDATRLESIFQQAKSKQYTKTITALPESVLSSNKSINTVLQNLINEKYSQTQRLRHHATVGGSPPVISPPLVKRSPVTNLNKTAGILRAKAVIVSEKVNAPGRRFAQRISRSFAQPVDIRPITITPPREWSAPKAAYNDEAFLDKFLAEQAEVSARGPTMAVNQAHPASVLPKVISPEVKEAAVIAETAVKKGGLSKLHIGGIGLGIGLAGLGLYSLFSGSDDNYNTIEGLSHKGIAKDMRHQMTDFGSGFIGRIFNVAKTLTNESFRTMKHTVNHMLIPGTKKGLPLELGVLGLTGFEAIHSIASIAGSTASPLGLAMAGASIVGSKFVYLGIKKRKIVKEGIKLAVNHPSETKKVLSSVTKNFGSQLWNYTIHNRQNELSVFTKFGGGDLGREALKGNLETITDSLIPQIQQAYGEFAAMPEHGAGVDMRHAMTPFKSQIDMLKNLFRGTGKEILEHAPVFKNTTFSPVQKLTEDILERVRVAEFAHRPSRLESTFWTPSVKEAEKYAEKGATFGGGGAATVSKVVTPKDVFITRQSGYTNLLKQLSSGNKNKAELIEHARGYWRGIDPTKVTKSELYDLEALLPGHTKASKAWGVQKRFGKSSKWNKIPKIQEASNEFPAMPEHGMAPEGRHAMTPFKSKFDLLRSLVRGGETFEEMIATKGFQKALNRAKETAFLGAGQGEFNKVYKMTTTFRGQEVSFAKKVTEIGFGKSETQAMRAAQGTVAPTLYGGKNNAIYMELMEGMDMEHLAKINPKKYEALKGKMQEAIKSVHDSGYTHGDMYSRNIFLAKDIKGEEQIGIIDFGYAKKTSVDFPTSYDTESFERDFQTHIPTKPKVVEKAHSILEPNNAKLKRKRMLQMGHIEAQVMSSKNGLRPGKGHTKQTGGLV